MLHSQSKEIEIFLTEIMKFPADQVHLFLYDSALVDTHAGNFGGLCLWAVTERRYGLDIQKAHRKFEKLGYVSFFQDRFIQDMQALIGPRILF